MSDMRPGEDRRREPGVALDVQKHQRAMLRGAMTAIIVATLAVGGVVVADRIGGDTTGGSTVTIATDRTTGAPVVGDTGVTGVTGVTGDTGDTGDTIVTEGPAVTPSQTVNPAHTLVPVDTLAPTIPPGATIPPGSTIPATPTIPPGTTIPATPIDGTATPPSVDAAAYAVLDLTSGRWLAELDADAQRPVGSVMKLLTAYVAMQAGDPEHTVTVHALELDPDESSIGLYEGEQLSRAILIRAMLIVSANDAAHALAVDVGGSQEGFVSMMNGAASSLGLSATVAANPIGLDASGAHSSARDMAGLAAVLMQDQTFRETVVRTSASLHGQTFAATNATFLTAYSGADGVKTGHTTDAGYCLAASATRDGRHLIVVVLGSSSEAARVASASTLLDWAFAQA